MAEHISLQKKARGERPQYFADPAIDKTLAITLARTEPCRVYEVAVKGVRSAAGQAPLHGIGWYTRNLEP